MARRKPVSFDKRGRITGGDIFERAALRDARRAVDKGLQISDRAFKNLGADNLTTRADLVSSLQQRAVDSGRGFEPVRGGRNLGQRDSPAVRQASSSFERVARRNGSLDELSPFVRSTLGIGSSESSKRERKALSSLLDSGRNRRDSRPNARGSRDDKRRDSMFGRRRRR